MPVGRSDPHAVSQSKPRLAAEVAAGGACREKAGKPSGSPCPTAHFPSPRPQNPILTKVGDLCGLAVLAKVLDYRAELADRVGLPVPQRNTARSAL